MKRNLIGLAIIAAVILISVWIVELVRQPTGSEKIKAAFDAIEIDYDAIDKAVEAGEKWKAEMAAERERINEAKKQLDEDTKALNDAVIGALD